MSINWSEVTLGAVSLFPLFGDLNKLRGFYFQQFKKWYIVISTIFSLFIYYFIQLQFEKLNAFPFFISPWWTLLFGMLFLILYLFILLAKKDKLLLSAHGEKSVYILSTIILYVLFIASLTYSFNTLQNYNEYFVVSGNVIRAGHDLGRSTATEISVIDVHGVKKNITYNIRNNGKFFFIIKKKDFNAIGDNDIFEFKYEEKGMVFLTKKFKKDLPSANSEWKNISLRSFK